MVVTPKADAPMAQTTDSCAGSALASGEESVYRDMYFVYVLRSETHHTRYVGSTDNVEKRVKEHNSGKVRYTKGRRPWKLAYQESYSTRGEAVKRELFLKSGQGRKYLDSISGVV